MPTTMTKKGQVTIPKAIRTRLGLKPGHRVEFIADETGRITVRPAHKGRGTTKSRFARLRGSATVRMTTDQIMALTRGER